MSNTAWDVDIYDDEYWRGFAGIMERRRQGLFASMDRLNAISRRLSKQVDEERPPEMPEEGERQERLRALVVRALETDDPAQWATVDAIVFGSGAE